MPDGAGHTLLGHTASLEGDVMSVIALMFISCRHAEASVALILITVDDLTSSGLHDYVQSVPD